MSSASRSVEDQDPVFAAAAAVAARRREYEARRDHFNRERARLTQPLLDAARFQVIEHITDDAFARAWATPLLIAGQAVAEAGMCELVEDDPEAWMPERLARAALRDADKGLAMVENAAECIVKDGMHREGVRPELLNIAGTLSRRLLERHEDAIRNEFPDLAPATTEPEGQGEDPPPAGTKESEGGKSNSAFAELLTAIDESGLSKAEAKVIRVIAEKNGSVPIVDANTLCDCDALSAFKRAKPKLLKRGWHLHEHHSSLCAKPLKQRGRN